MCWRRQAWFSSICCRRREGSVLGEEDAWSTRALLRRPAGHLQLLSGFGKFNDATSITPATSSFPACSAPAAFPATGAARSPRRVVGGVPHFLAPVTPTGRNEPRSPTGSQAAMGGARGTRTTGVRAPGTLECTARREPPPFPPSGAPAPSVLCSGVRVGPPAAAPPPAPATPPRARHLPRSRGLPACAPSPQSLVPVPEPPASPHPLCQSQASPALPAPLSLAPASSRPPPPSLEPPPPAPSACLRCPAPLHSCLRPSRPLVLVPGAPCPVPCACPRRPTPPRPPLMPAPRPACCPGPQSLSPSALVPVPGDPAPSAWASPSMCSALS